MSNIQKSPSKTIADFRCTEAFTKDKDSTSAKFVYLVKKMRLQHDIQYNHEVI